MGSRYCKIKRNFHVNAARLRSLGLGVFFFSILCVFTKVFQTSLCPIRNLFGIRCFGCGMTRGFIAILNLKFISACKYNILSLPVFTGIVLYCTVLFIDLLTGKDYIIKVEKQLSRKYMYAIYLAVLIISVLFNKGLLR